MESRRLLTGSIMIIVALAASACGGVRVRDSGREGLLDRLARESHGNPRPEVSKSEEEQESKVRSADLAKAHEAAKKWGWPLHEVTVTSPFGKRGGDFHEGVDLRAKKGTAVYAIEEGVVSYADQRLRGYGRMVLIRHAHGLSSVYAHNSKLLVRKGQLIRKGQKIALSGNTGHSKGPHLHFEIREGVLALDPMEVLPSASGRSLARVRGDMLPPTAPDPSIAAK